MTIVKGYLKDSNNNYYSNTPVYIVSRKTGDLLGETITGNGSELLIDDTYYNNVVMFLKLNKINRFNDLSKNKMAISNIGVIINESEGIEQDGAAVFNSGFYLQSNPIIFSNVDLCMEAYVKLTTMPVSDNWPGAWYNTFSIGGVGTPNAADGFNLCLGASKIFLNNNDGMICYGNHEMVINTWYHIEVIRQGPILKTRVNGQDKASYNIGTSILGTGSGFYIGCETGQGANLNGYMNDFRVTLLNCRYPNNFTPDFKHFRNNKANIGGPIGYYEIDVNYVGEIDIIAQLSNKSIIKRVNLK